MQAKVEAAPRAFFDWECRPAWDAVRGVVAARFGAQAQDLAVIENVTDGVNAILRSLSFRPGDEILITSMTYGAIVRALTHIVAQTGARVVEARLPFPAGSRDAFVEAIETALTPRTRLAILDHITSSTALILPVAEMAQACRARGVAALIDGAHAPGQVALDLSSTPADYYVGNLHKWCFAPRGCGFLWARRDRQQNSTPTILSWGADEPFPHDFWWTGTRDPSSWLSIPAAFAFLDRLGEDRIRRHNHALALEASLVLGEAWGAAVETPGDSLAGMALVPLPDSAAFASTGEGRADIQRTLWEAHRIACPCVLFEGRLHVRASAQIYNERSDYERLARAIDVMKRAS